MRKYIVNVAFQGREHYVVGQSRLLRSFWQHRDGEQTLFYTSAYPPGSPLHKEVPYAFKYYAMREAFHRGADQVLWLDAACVIRKPLKPFWERITNEGMVVVGAGAWEAQFTCEATLRYLGCSIEEAKTFAQICGGIVGYSKHDERAMQIFAEMNNAIREGWPIRGEGGSSYPKFIAHRHDQSCLSYLVHKYEVPVVRANTWVCYSNDKKVVDAVIELRGIP